MNENVSIGPVSLFSPITLGETLACVEVNGLVFTETMHKANRRLPRHFHERANVAFTLSGSFTEKLDRRRFECASQSLIFKPVGEAHANEYGRMGMRCLLIEVQPQRLESLYPASRVFDQVGHARGTTLSMIALRIWKEMLLMDTASLLAMEGLALELMAELSRHSRLIFERKAPRWLERAREILQERSFQTISLDDVATLVDIHPVHLAREFRRFYGCTLGEYIRGVRIQFACHKLSTSNTSLVDIALEAGFAHQAHFSRVFKRYIGISPSAFRRNFRVSR